MDLKKQQHQDRTHLVNYKQDRHCQPNKQQGHNQLQPNLQKIQPDSSGQDQHHSLKTHYDQWLNPLLLFFYPESHPSNGQLYGLQVHQCSLRLLLRMLLILEYIIWNDSYLGQCLQFQVPMQLYTIPIFDTPWCLKMQREIEIQFAILHSHLQFPFQMLYHYCHVQKQQAHSQSNLSQNSSLHKPHISDQFDQNYIHHTYSQSNIPQNECLVHNLDQVSFNVW